MKFVVCLQFYEADKPQAMRLARLIADIEPTRRDDVEIIFVARFDCDHDRETIDYVARRFPVHWFTTHTRWTGWPSGPNSVAKDTLEWLAANRKDAVGALLIEPDCVPTSLSWITDLISVWDSMYTASRGLIWLAGAWRDSGGGHGHINGNMICRPDLASLIDLGVIDQHMAWDCQIVPQILKHWAKNDAIRNCFESRNATEKDLFWAPIGSEAPLLVHGFKDDSAYNLARQHLLFPDTTPLSL